MRNNRPPTQPVEQQPDGSIILLMHAAGTTELLNWVLGYDRGVLTAF
ncbi:WYL domain-containing protein [bacterium]|nr:WYL domain-containing protein [bacterium]